MFSMHVNLPFTISIHIVNCTFLLGTQPLRTLPSSVMRVSVRQVSIEIQTYLCVCCLHLSRENLSKKYHMSTFICLARLCQTSITRLINQILCERNQTLLLRTLLFHTLPPYIIRYSVGQVSQVQLI